MVLGIFAVLLGMLISLVGLLVGLLGRTWIGFATGLGVLVVGMAIWLLPSIHLFLRACRLQTKLERQLSANKVGQGISWKNIKHKFFTVIKFTPNASVSGNTVRANSAFEPYATLTIESPAYDTSILMPVLHRLDFLNLWRVFNEHIVADDEEVIVTYDTDRWLGRMAPNLPIMIALKNTVKKLTDISSLPTAERVDILRSIKHYWNPPHPGSDLHAIISLRWGLWKL